MTSMLPSSLRDDVFGAGIERRFHQLVFVGARREQELAAMLEQERDRAVRAEIAAVFGEGVAHIRDGAHAVVGHAIDHYGRALDAVAFVADFLVVHAFQVATAALDRALDVVLGHVLLIRLVDRQAQPRIAVEIAAAQPRGNGDFLDEPGENLAALGVLRGFLVLDISPLAVTRHDAYACCLY